LQKYRFGDGKKMYSAPGSQKSALAKNASNFGRLSGERLGVAQNTISGIIRNCNLTKIDKDLGPD